MKYFIDYIWLRKLTSKDFGDEDEEKY